VSHSVYIFKSADVRVLYVGCTADLPRRLDEHRRDKPWWCEVATVEVEHFASKDEALRRESMLIRALRPERATGYRRYVGSGIRCAFDRFCGNEADRAYAVLQCLGRGRGSTRKVRHVCPEHELKSSRPYWFHEAAIRDREYLTATG
jgi:predicted GIY-YIG superfamily endonuclease